jgi:hemerythrin-like domain-containing protein
MLTATYTLVALSVEQASVRVSLQSLQNLLQTNFVHQNALTPGQVDYACDALRRLYDTCHWRKIEKFLIPAIRRANSQADRLLAELDALNSAAAEAMRKVMALAPSRPIDSPSRVSEFCSAIEQFCGALLCRLEREENELFPVARAGISGEAWFSIANQMLAHDAYVLESKQTGPTDIVVATASSRRRRIEHDEVHPVRVSVTH